MAAALVRHVAPGAKVLELPHEAYAHDLPDHWDKFRDLFDAARFSLRPRSPESGRSGFPAIQEWVDVFKDKRRQLAEKRCAP